MAKVKIINETYEQSSPMNGKLFITEDERIIISRIYDENVLIGTYLDTGGSVTIGISSVSPVPPTWKIELSND